MVPVRGNVVKNDPKGRSPVASVPPTGPPLTPSAPPPSGPGRGALVRHAVMLQLKLLLEGLKDILLGPVSLVALAVDLLVRRSADGRLFYETLRRGQRFERFLNLYGALPEHRDSATEQASGTTIDAFLKTAERQIQRAAGSRGRSFDGPEDRG